MILSIIQPIKRIFKQDGFSGNVARLMTGNITAQAISLLAIPVITRLFSPENYGIFSLYASLAIMFSVFSSLSYVSALLLPKDDDDACNIFGLCILVVFGMSLLVLTGIFFFNKNICHLLNAPQMELYLWLLPLSIFFDGIYLSFNYWSLRKKRFTQLSISRVLESLSDRTLALCAGFFGYVSAFVLIISRLLGVLLSILTLGFSVWREDRGSIKASLSKDRIFFHAKRYRKFPLISNWSILLNNVSRQIPIIMLAIFFTPKIVGLYALSTRVLAMPMSLLGDAIFRVFFQKIAEIKNQGGKLTDLSLELLHHLICLSIIPLIFLAIIGKEVFSLVFGSSWELAGTYTQILSFVFFMSFISRPFGAFFNVFEKQEVRLYFDTVLLVSGGASFFIGGLMNSALLAIALYSISSVIVFLILIFWSLKFVGVSNIKIFVVLGHSFILAFPFLAMLAFTKFVLHCSPVVLVIFSIILMLLYYLLLVYRDERMKSIITCKTP